jgi:hypothetical protein
MSAKSLIPIVGIENDGKKSLIPIVGIENDGKIRLVIILEQLMCPGSTDNTVSIRVKLYKVHTECREGVIVEDMTEQGICSRRIRLLTIILNAYNRN